jgi:hypothetical protein
MTRPPATLKRKKVFEARGKNPEATVYRPETGNGGTAAMATVPGAGGEKRGDIFAK